MIAVGKVLNESCEGRVTTMGRAATKITRCLATAGSSIGRYLLVVKDVYS